jgi:hypothetical protein
MQTCLGTSVAGLVLFATYKPIAHTNNLNLDINLDKLLAERIDLDQTRIDRSVEATKLGDQTDIAL